VQTVVSARDAPITHQFSNLATHCFSGDAGYFGDREQIDAVRAMQDGLTRCRAPRAHLMIVGSQKQREKYQILFEITAMLRAYVSKNLEKLAADSVFET